MRGQRLRLRGIVTSRDHGFRAIRPVAFGGEKGGGKETRRTLALVTVAAATLIAFASPALAQTTVDFNALFHEEFQGASPFQPCPTGDPADPCGVGHIRDFGSATVRYEQVSGEPVDSCFHAIFVATMTLQDGSGTLVIEEDDTFCTPGGSTDAPGNQLHSFGNPFTIEGTWVVISGTGVFEGATGGGTNTATSGGDVIIDRYAGTIQLP
jgi:hypothetical protein